MIKELTPGLNFIYTSLYRGHVIEVNDRVATIKWSLLATGEHVSINKHSVDAWWLSKIKLDKLKPTKLLEKYVKSERSPANAGSDAEAILCSQGG